MAVLITDLGLISWYKLPVFFTIRQLVKVYLLNSEIRNTPQTYHQISLFYSRCMMDAMSLSKEGLFLYNNDTNYLSS